ncbi:hypothetical protein A3Q56_07088, partial [Intoshia linei]
MAKTEKLKKTKLNKKLNLNSSVEQSSNLVEVKRKSLNKSKKRNKKSSIQKKVEIKFSSSSDSENESNVANSRLIKKNLKRDRLSNGEDLETKINNALNLSSSSQESKGLTNKKLKLEIFSSTSDSNDSIKIYKSKSNSTKNVKKESSCSASSNEINSSIGNLKKIKKNANSIESILTRVKNKVVKKPVSSTVSIKKIGTLKNTKDVVSDSDSTTSSCTDLDILIENINKKKSINARNGKDNSKSLNLNSTPILKKQKKKVASIEKRGKKVNKKSISDSSSDEVSKTSKLTKKVKSNNLLIKKKNIVLASKISGSSSDSSSDNDNDSTIKKKNITINDCATSTSESDSNLDEIKKNVSKMSSKSNVIINSIKKVRNSPVNTSIIISKINAKCDSESEDCDIKMEKLIKTVKAGKNKSKLLNDSSSSESNCIKNNDNLGKKTQQKSKMACANLSSSDSSDSKIVSSKKLSNKNINKCKQKINYPKIKSIDQAKSNDFNIKTQNKSKIAVNSDSSTSDSDNSELVPPKKTSKTVKAIVTRCNEKVKSLKAKLLSNIESSSSLDSDDSEPKKPINSKSLNVNNNIKDCKVAVESDSSSDSDDSEPKKAVKSKSLLK